MSAFATGAAVVRIHRSSPAGDFAIIPNETLRDERLSFAARGHLAYLLSRPDGWKTGADDEAERATRLRNKRGEGREAMRRVYRELKDAGYIQVARLAGPGGRWTSETHVYDRPFSEFPQVAPTYGSPGRPACHGRGAEDGCKLRAEGAGRERKRVAQSWKGPPSSSRLAKPPHPHRKAPQPATSASAGFSLVSSGRPGVGLPGVGSPDVGTPGVGSPDVGSADRRFTRTSSTKTEEEDRDQAADQVQEQPLTNSQNRRVRQGPKMVTDDAPDFSPDDAESTTAGSTRARVRRTSASAA